MTITITSNTFYSAPDGQPNSRQTIGVGEPITFRANRIVRWTVAGLTKPGHHSSIIESFLSAGDRTIIAEHAGQRSSLEVSVVAPSLRYDKISDVLVPSGLSAIGYPMPSGTVGAAMKLRITLTPLGVSFAGLEFRERACTADNIWGYFATHRHVTDIRNLFPHRPNDLWALVDRENKVVDDDRAAIGMVFSRLPWPLTAGGFRWLIPNEYRIGSQIHRFDVPTPQVRRFDPASPDPPFRGTFTLWKGGRNVVRVY